MDSKKDQTSVRKKEHLALSLNSNVGFKTKNNGFENYDFVHNAITEVELDNISFETKFFKKKINYPFLISCMTGGTEEAENINAQLAIVAEDLNIPIGVGSQRQALENKNLGNTYDVIRKNAKSVPVLGNLGAAQLVKLKSFDQIQTLIDIVQANAFVVHLNPIQEMLQPEGTPNFKGLLKALEKLVKEIEVPVIVKEVGSGISSIAAKKILNAGVKGIDVAGAGGTSWAAIELLRNKSYSSNNSKTSKDFFWDWGLPTSYCIKENAKLKKKNKFVLIGSGGINSAIDAAKALALGSDLVASARIILKELNANGIEGVKSLITDWFYTIGKIMFLTGSETLKDFKKNKIIRKEFLY